MKLTSWAFSDGGMMPSKYTCDGINISPPLEISDMPDGTVSFALVMDDPDAVIGTFDHWVLWNIPADTKTIAEGCEPSSVGGMTGFGKIGYGGPCPPSGVHSYKFKLYALSRKLDLKGGFGKKALESEMKGNIIEKTVLTGKYKRR